MSIETLFLVPETRPGRGTGHFRRLLSLALRHPESYLYLPENHCASWEQSFPALEKVHHGSRLPEKGTSCIVLDRFKIDEHEAQFWAGFGPLVGIDSRGPGAAYCVYVVDTMPRIESGKPGESGNVSSTDFLDLLPEINSREASSTKNDYGQVKKILVSFGGEDAKGQTKTLADNQWLEKHFPLARITMVHGARMHSMKVPETWTMLKSPAELRRHLPEYDLVVTMFGLTAYEALAAGIPVLLWNPTSYHQRLSVIAGFASAGCGRRPKNFRDTQLLLSRIRAKSRAFSWESKDLGQFIKNLKLPFLITCPTCGNSELRTVARYPERSFLDCRKCGMRSMVLSCDQPVSYTEEYFGREYRKQYGRTYLEDFQHIKHMGKKRLVNIKRLKKQGRLLDIGCAYGPFLDAARDEGYQVGGIDISVAAVTHVKDVLGIPARTLDVAASDSQGLRDSVPGGSKLDVVTMWYVIEHFSGLTGLLKAINQSLETGGVFAFSTPNGRGISARKNIKTFLQESPFDHYTVWDASSARRVLALYGFKLRIVRGAGHHPERFPGVLGTIPFRALSLLLSRFMRLADTFEVYAVKTKDCL